jgi:hypothetical protein
VRERQHFLVWDPQTGQVHIGYRQYVVAELPQSFDGWVGKVLISEEAGQRLGLLILSDLTVDLVEVTSDKRPGVHQVSRSECGECAQDLAFSQTEPPVMLQRPDRIRVPAIRGSSPHTPAFDSIPEPRRAKSCSTVASIIVNPPRRYSSASRRTPQSRIPIAT